MTEAILLNPTSAIMYAARGEICLFSFMLLGSFSSLDLLARFCGLIINTFGCGISSASIYIKMKKPNAAIRDANAALEVCFLFGSLK